MPKTYTIKITFEDIEKGRRFNNGGPCPVALATRRVFPEQTIYIGCTYITGCPFRKWYQFKAKNPWCVNLSHTIKQWIADFDAGKYVHPQTFKITLP